MSELLAVLFGPYAAVAAVSMLVYRVRAGLGWWHRLRLSGPGGVGGGWIALTLAKSVAWPVVLVLWLRDGRPEPTTLFGAKARRSETGVA